MLFNKLRVLDKGFVSLVSSCNGSVRLKELKNEFFRAQLHPDFLKIANATLYIKCPLFIQLNLAKYGFTITNIPPAEEKNEVYLPDETEIGSSNLEVNRAIADDIARTSEALLINPLSYREDGCDRFLSQVATPINVYSEILVHGTLEQWLVYLSQKDIPKQAEAYLIAIQGLLLAEWDNLKELKELAKNRFV